MYMQQTVETGQKNTLYREDKTAANRTGVPYDMKRQYEELSGLSMDDVRVHYNSGKPSKLGALAYTQGSHVYVAPGQERHLGHELGHVIQQKQGRVRATDSFDNVAVNLDDRLEREADAYDRQARAYGAERKAEHPGEYEAMPEPGRGMSGGVIQLRPVVDKKRNRPFYLDTKYDGRIGRPFLLKLFVEMTNYIVFQIRDHVRRIFWEKDLQWAQENPGTDPKTIGALPDTSSRKTGQDQYFTDRSFKSELNIEEFLSMQPLDAWLETYEEAMGSLAEIDADTALAAEEKERRKNAITNYVLQRHIVNALYRAEELDRMNYSGSPLSYQNRSSYMRSGAGSFVDMLQQVLLEKGNPFPKKDVILLRSKEMRQELNKFFYYIPLSEESDVETVIQQNLSDDLIEAIAQLIVELQASKGESEDNALQRKLEEGEFPRILIDATERPKAADIDQINQKLRDLVFLKIAQKMKLSGNPEDFLWVKRMDAATKDVKIQSANDRLHTHPDEGEAFITRYIQQLEQSLPQDPSRDTTPQHKADRTKLKQIKSVREKKVFSPEDVRLATTYINYVKDSISQDTAGKWELLYRNMSSFATTGEITTLANEGIQQSALILADTGMDSLAKAAVNKAGYVPSITEAVRMLMQYSGRQVLQPPQESPQTLQWIAYNVWGQQNKSQWNRQDKLSTPGEWTGRKEAMTKAEKRIRKPGSAQYQAGNTHGAKKLAQTGFELFCMWLECIEKVPEKRRIAIQASVIKKLMEKSELFSNTRIPSFIWYQLDYYLEAAKNAEEDIVDFARNIQALHEIILLGIELAGEEPLPRGTDFTLKAAEQADQEPGSYRGAYLADYGLKAFAQVYDAAAAQHEADSDEQPLQVAAFYNIYFELTEKLDKTTATNHRKVSMAKPRDVAAFLADVKDTSGEKKPLEKLPDIIMIDIHPNDATKELITANDICGLLRGIADLQGTDGSRKISMIIDITLNQAMDSEVQGIIRESKPYIADGWLNLVFVQSLTKFAQMGMDKHSGGLVFSYNKEDDWRQFNDSLQAGRKADPVDPYMQKYFQMLFDNAAEEQREYINIIRANTIYVQNQLSTKLAGTAITLSDNDDAGSCYVAWRYEVSYNKIRELYKSCGLGGALPYTLHEFNIAILERGINARMSKQKLPVAMRFSFGFPISNLGETGNEVRFTIGTETSEELDGYITVIADVGKAVQKLIDQASSSPQEEMCQSCLFDMKKFETYLLS